MMKFKSDLKTIYPLVKLSNVLAIAPPYNFGEQPEPCTRKCKIYASVVLAAILSGYFYNVYGKLHNEIIKNFDMVQNLIDFAATAFLTMASTSLTVITVLWRAEKFKSLLFSIEKFDSSIGLKCGKSKRRFWAGYIALQLITLSTIFIDSFVWIKTLGLKIYVYYIAKYVMWYQFNVGTFLIFWLALEIEGRFREVNRLLIRCARGKKSSFLIPTLLYEYSIVNRKDKPFYIRIPDTVLLRSIKFWYNDFVTLVEEFNSIFGLNLLFVILFNITNVVHYTEILMLHVIYKKVETDFEVGFIFLSLMWITVAFVQTMAIAAACESLANEAGGITAICYTLLSEVSSFPKTDYEAALRKELLLLAEQTGAGHPKVSAAGFFEVNFGMMGFVVASVTSYIIVTIQFM
ncbi:uncharacterized protein LOC108915810 [Anoplophora glabripennis]|uniref:uncharacterized protein LOC108915810 n=1 Tax=Anoplophora glabripennis TaxID=217634 RepID=UPI0008746501|nr:uncharacterized protein LOC108915810 [Anoplophora glabripennis]